MTETDIQWAIGHSYGFQNVVIPNVILEGKADPRNEPLFPYVSYEADLVWITQAGYLTEVEIKISFSDFMADFKKKAYHSNKSVRNFYYAFSEELFKTKRNDIMGQLMKEAPDSGVMVVSARYGVKLIVKPVPRGKALKLTTPEMFNLMRIGCMKWWTRGHTYELRK